MADVGITVTGLDELRRGLRRVNTELPKELTRIHRGIAQPVAERARGRAPRKSGRLAGSVKAQAGQKYARVAAGRKLIPYAGVIHFGWPRRNIRPQPFLTDSINELAPRLLDDYLAQLTNLVGDAIDG